MSEQKETEPNIYTVTQVLRSFSNDVTVQNLAAKLNVSYSTLARCKSGICPPSITFRALRRAFDDYKILYFHDDDRAVFDAVVEQLGRRGLAANGFIQVFENEGYDAFVNTFLATSLANSGKDTAAGSLTLAESKDFASASSLDKYENSADSSKDNRSTTTAPLPANQRAEHVTNERETNPASSIAFGMAGWIPIVVLVGMGLLQIPLDSLLSWIAGHMGPFLALSLGIAALPVILGLAVDAPLAWRQFKLRKPEASFSGRTWHAVSKFGDDRLVIPGEGRFDTSGDHLSFALLSNVTGALCAISLIAFLAPLPNFLDYFTEHNWTEYFKAAMVLAFFIAYHHTTMQQRLPRPTEQSDARNPDNYLYSRAHVWANIVHLVWVITLSTIFALCMIGYNIAHFQQYNLPLGVLWPVAQTVLFLVYANLSPYAARHKVSSIGSFAGGLIVLAVCMVGMVVCFRLSWTSAVAIAVYAALAAIAFAWRRRMEKNPEMQTWLEQGNASRIYGVLIAAVIVGLAAIGFATSSIA